MRLVIALAMIAAAAAIRTTEFGSISETIFRPGFEYLYRYESQVLSGIRTVSNQVSGIKINAVIKLQFHRSEGVTLKMQHVNIFKVNDVVSGLHKIEMLPDSEVTRLTGEQEQTLMEQLVKPIKFRWEEGEVRDVQTTRTDKYWSINIKKGLLSLLQVKLNGRSTSWSDSDSLFPESTSFSSHRSIKSKLFDTFNPIGSRRLTTSRLDSAFKVMEMDVNGECETKYVINTDRSEDLSSVSEMIVTKVKNFDNCLVKNTYDQGLFAHLPHFPSERMLIQPGFEAEYVLTGDRHHFLIKKATVEAKYFFKPYGPEGGQLSTHITQKLHLVSTNEIQNPISVENPVVEKHGLKMEIPRSQWTPENSVYGENFSEQEWKEVVDEKLNKLISAIYPVMQETATAELFQLQLVIRHVPRRQLLSIIKSYVHEREETDEIRKFNKKGEILLDILPTCINPDTGKVLLDLIRDGTIRGIRARLSISAMVLTVKPTPEIVKTMMSMYREGVSLERTTPHLRQTLLLGVGTVCNKMINHMRKVNKPIPELTNTVEEISQELSSLLSESGSEMDKIRVLKSMGNMGAKELITPIKSIIEDRSMSKILRSEAIIALRKLAKPFDKMVHPILLSVILDKNEVVQVRIAAITVLKNSVPTYTTLQLLSHCLRTEPSTQVKTFIYTTLISLANIQSPLPELQQTKKDAHKVLKTMRAIPIGILDSKDLIANLHSERLNMGVSWNMQTIKADRSGLPHSIFSMLHTTIFGNRFKLAKVGAEGELVTAILRRLIGPYGLLKDIIKNKATMFDLLKPLTRPEMTTHWRDFISKKSYEPVGEDEVEGLVFGELLGYEMVYRKFDKETLESWMNIAMSRGPELISKLKEGITVDTLKTFSLSCNSLVMPTPIGIPLSLNVSSNAIFKLEGYVRARSLPSFMDFIRRRPFMTKKIEIETRVKPSWNVETFGYMGIDMRWIRTGVALKAHAMGKLPIKGEVIVDPVDSKVVVKIEPPTENIKSFVAKIEPVTFVYYVPKNIMRLPFIFELKPCKTHEHIKHMNYEKDYVTPIIGMEWNVKSKWTMCGSTWCPYYPLTGKQEVFIGYKSLSSTPKEIVLKIKKFTQDWYNENEEVEIGINRNYRTGSRILSDEEDIDHEFDPVEKDSIISTPRKVEVLVELGLSGFESNKMLKGKITWLSENNYLEHQLNMQVLAVPSADNEQFKLMLNSVWRMPYTFESSESYSTKEPIGKIEVHWGKSGYREKTIKCKIFEVDGSMWAEEMTAEGMEHSTEVSTMYGFSPKVFRYGVEAVFPQMTPRAQMYLTKVHDFIKFAVYRYLKVGIPENIPQNKVVVYGQYITKLAKLSVIIKTPRETNIIMNVPIQCSWSRFYRPSLHDLNPRYLYSNVTDEIDIDEFDRPTYDNWNDYKDYSPSLLGVCKIHKDKLLSFDGTPVLLPIHERETGGSRCDVLLSRDCSNRGTFAVTGSFKNNHWAIKMIVPKYTIEIIPDRSMSLIAIKVNDEEVRVHSSNPFMLYEEPHNENSELLVTITQISEGMKVKFHELGVTVLMEERSNIKIKVSPLSVLQGRLCGLCGNNNYDVSDDMTSMMGKKLSSPHSFVMDNIMPSGYCDASDYETQLGLRHTGYCMTKKTMKIERTMNSAEMTCFSKMPVTMCRRHCTPETMTTHSVRFVCMPTEEENTQKLVEKFESGEKDLTDFLSEFSANFNEEVEIPEKCTTNY